MYEERSYRKRFRGVNLEFFNVCVLETDLSIGAESNLYKEALCVVEKYRAQLESYIKEHPLFKTSLEPVEPLPGAPQIVMKMCEAAKKAGVGPMAAVAGAFSELVGQELLNFSKEIIVENGGDIYLKSERIRTIGIYAGKSPLSDKLAVEILPQQTPMGICTSSGTVGHSLSFGKADAAVILSRDTFLADALATAVGNMVKAKEDIEPALNYATSFEDVLGALVIIGSNAGVKGQMKIVEL
ncbi:MAG: UPF0280 family protein [Clostridia bacterium]|nr:UPF0280 family protein [Clostridia bacterium]